MTAQLIIHPRCVDNQEASNMLAAFLYAQGYDVYKALFVYEHWSATSKRKVHELVRDRGATDGGVLYESLNGTQFTHLYKVPPAPRHYPGAA